MIGIIRMYIDFIIDFILVLMIILVIRACCDYFFDVIDKD